MRFTTLIVLILGSVSLSAPQNSKTKSDSKGEQKAQWSKKMSQLSETLSELLPEISSSKTTPARTEMLKKNVKKLTGLAHSLRMEGKTNVVPPDADPTVLFISDLFERETKRAQSALNSGNIDYAKGLLRSATGYCIACHSRSNSGPSFPKWELPAAAKNLAKPEKADLLAAMRRFDQALEEYISIIADPQLARSQQIIWQRAVSRALALAVRVKKDPDQAMSIVQTAETVKSAPDFFKEQLTGWKKSVESWKKEAPRKTLSEEGLFAEATRLTQEGKALQKYPADNAADVVYLRATAAVHDLLREYPKSTHSSEALLLAGISYEVLNDPLTWPIHETYYEACIRNKPNTEISATCFNRFEKSVYFGYSGSGGVSIPGDIDTLLKELKGLAVAKEEK